MFVQVKISFKQSGLHKNHNSYRIHIENLINLCLKDGLIRFHSFKIASTDATDFSTGLLQGSIDKTSAKVHGKFLFN
jgi:hypothetical protein